LALPSLPAACPLVARILPRLSLEATMTARVINADVLDGIRTLPDRSVQCVISSPPYFGLRSYLPDGHPDKALEVGTEETPDGYVARLVDVFREVRRVLRDDACVFLNLGDSFGPGKQLQGIPWRVAFALQADGWILRSDIIWAKPNPMPSSVTDRPTTAHEYVFLLAKRARYYFDADAIREDNSLARPDRIGLVKMSSAKNVATREAGGNGQNPDSAVPYGEGGRNKRSVWTVATQPFPGSHFAVFPPKLIEPCVLAGAPAQACGTCGAPWTRVAERTPMVVEPSARRAAGHSAGVANGRSSTSGTMIEAPTSRTVGWTSSCSHDDGTACGVVLDPFCGSGTVGVVAGWHGRDFIGIELSETYAQMARERIALEGRPGGPPEDHKPVSVIPGQIGLLEDVA
jgi:DNA modification methylase